MATCWNVAKRQSFKLSRCSSNLMESQTLEIRTIEYNYNFSFDEQSHALHKQWCFWINRLKLLGVTLQDKEYCNFSNAYRELTNVTISKLLLTNTNFIFTKNFTVYWKFVSYIICSVLDIICNNFTLVDQNFKREIVHIIFNILGMFDIRHYFTLAYIPFHSVHFR